MRETPREKKGLTMRQRQKCCSRRSGLRWKMMRKTEQEEEEEEERRRRRRTKLQSDGEKLHLLRKELPTQVNSVILQHQKTLEMGSSKTNCIYIACVHKH